MDRHGIGYHRIDNAFSYDHRGAPDPAGLSEG
jgi:hypothetical protein